MANRTPGWRVVRLFEVADQRTEKIIPTGEDTRRYVALEHLAQGQPTVLGCSHARTASSAKTVFRTGDVLFGKLRPNLRKAAAAPFDGLCSTDILPLFGRDGLDTSYLLQLAQWHPLQRHAVATSSGTKMPRTSWKQLGEFTFLLPPLPEQRKIAAILSSVDDVIEKTQAVIDQVQVVKRGLMQELLTRGLPGRHTRFKQTEIGKIPEEWDLLPLKCFIKNGPANGLYRPQQDYGDGTPIIRIDAFDNGDRLQRPQLKRVSLRSEDVKRFAVRPGDILINRVNSLTHLAKCALALSFDESTVYESNLMRLSLNDARLTTEFGFRWLSSEYVKTNLRSKAKQAVAQASINQSDVRAIPTPCPPPSEQRYIARVIGQVDERLETEGCTLAELCTTKSALMSVLLTGELRVIPDHEVA